MAASLLASCTTIGPAAIRGGRLAYNEAIAETDRQQMLTAIINNRYNEHGSLLAVSSITANVSLSAGTSLQFGLGDKDTYAGNLVPLSARALYEENPTISYTPVAGEQYLRRLMSPLPISTLAQLAGTLADPAPIYSMLVASVNDISNPDFRFFAEAPDPRFARFVSLMTTLTHAHCLHWIDDSQRPGGLAILIGHYAPDHTDEVSELLHLLGVDVPQDSGAPIHVPVRLALLRGATPGIAITTRSVFQLVEILSSAMEVPPSDQRPGVTQDYPQAGTLGSALRIHWADAKPERAAVAAGHRGGWFYIADDDHATKGYFRVLSTLWSATVAESTASTSTKPVLTLPIGR